MAESNNFSLLDEIEQQTSSVTDVCQKLNNQLSSSSSTLPDEYFQGHIFFTQHLPNKLCEILEFWHIDGSLDENQKATFRACTNLILDLTKDNKVATQWLNQQTAIIDITKECANDIASYGYYVDLGGEEDPNLESFDWLIQAFTYSRCEQLLDIISRCISNRYYMEAMYHFSYVNASILSLTQHFLLITCPDFLYTCDNNQPYIQTVLQNMLQQYAELFAHFLPHIERWTASVVLALFYPIRFILSGVRGLTLTIRYEIQKTVVGILLKQPTVDQDIEQARITLVHTALRLLLELVRSDSSLLSNLKKQTIEEPKLLEILQQLSDDQQNEKVQLYAFELVTLLIPEEEFNKKNKSAEITGIFMKEFTTARQDKKDERAGDLLRGLKDLVKNDLVKEQIVEQNGIPSIIQYTKDTPDDPEPLEVIYALTFNEKAKNAIHEDQEFVDHVKEMKKSEKKDVSKVAHGIMWKLEVEDTFKKEREGILKKESEAKEKKTEDGSTTESDTKEKTDEDKPEAYDLMISYCWAQKPVCHQIADRLEKDGLNVWLDRDEMHGSIIERMAEAIEQSRFVLVCMSSNYKKSINCQAEAEYAYNRKSKIIPLMVEENYKADGWLGFVAGSKIYVNFAGKDDDEFEEAYKKLIAELEGLGLHDKPVIEQAKAADSPPATEEPVPEEPEPPVIQTREYQSVGPISTWTNEHVNEFLTDHQLAPLVTVCKSMDGETFCEFYQLCQANPIEMYPLVNNPKEEHPVPLDIYVKFLTKLKPYQPPPAPRKVAFQYNFVYAPPTANGEPKNQNKV